MGALLLLLRLLLLLLLLLGHVAPGSHHARIEGRALRRE